MNTQPAPEASSAAPEQDRSVERRLLWFVLVLLGLLGAWIWANDAVTPQGERTVYTVDCVGGNWQGTQCSGHLVPGARYRFRALKPHKEVLFWTLGASSPSGRFTDCTIGDGRNWQCKASADAQRTITLQMSHGSPVESPGAPTLPFREVPKWRWWLMRVGISLGSGV